jgi:hypothetical protein
MEPFCPLANSSIVSPQSQVSSSFYLGRSLVFGHGVYAHM